MDIKAELQAFCDEAKEVGSSESSKRKSLGSLIRMIGHIEPDEVIVPEDIFSGLGNESRKIVLLSFLTVSLQAISGAR